MEVRQPGRDPVRALDAIETISATGRGTMAELRQLLEVLGPQEDAPSVEPAPGVREIDVLVERVRAAGQPVELHVDGDATRVPATAGLAAFRVVQEGLTNAVKHAPGAATQVRIVLGEELEVEVRDVGAPDRPDQVASAGRGLAGLSERIRLLGGRLTAGATEAGGFAPRATIPLQPTGS
jgi:signal transduction histidine kinase